MIVIADYWLGGFTLNSFKKEILASLSGRKDFQLLPCAHEPYTDWYVIRKEGRNVGMIEVMQRMTDRVQVLVGTVNGHNFGFVPHVKAWLEDAQNRLSLAGG